MREGGVRMHSHQLRCFIASFISEHFPTNMINHRLEAYLVQKPRRQSSVDQELEGGLPDNSGYKSFKS